MLKWPWAKKLLLLGVFLGMTGTAHAFNFVALITGWLNTVNQTVSSLRVVTKQNSVSADKVGQGNRDATSALATSIVAHRQAIMTKDAVERFKDQGIFACYAHDMAGHAASSVEKSEKAKQKIAASIQNMNYGDSATRVAAKMELHNAVYCSVSEHKAGLCKLNMAGMQYADADFSFVVKDGTKSSSEWGAGYDYIDNILPPRSVEKCKGAACIAAHRDMIALNAVDSLARNTMMSIIESRSAHEKN